MKNYSAKKSHRQNVTQKMRELNTLTVTILKMTGDMDGLLKDALDSMVQEVRDDFSTYNKIRLEMERIAKRNIPSSL
jgi:serine protease inhibitor